MYCTKCGKQLQDDVAFCPACGAPQKANRAAAAPQKKTGKSSGKLGKIFRYVITVLLIAVVGQFATSFVDEVLFQPEKMETIQDDGVIDPRYTQIFAQNQIVPPFTAFAGRETAFYVREDEGMLDSQELAHEDGVVTAMCEKVYLKIDGMDESSRSLLHETMMDSLNPWDTLSNCDVTYEFRTNCYVYTVTLKELDSQQKLDDCFRMGILSRVDETEEGESGLLSIKLTEEMLLDTGYIKR